MNNSWLKNNVNIKKDFQRSINIFYDLYNDDVIEKFIPTDASIEIFEEILLSTVDNSVERARILVGSYGKGKSHIISVLLSLLLKKDISIFATLLSKIERYSQDLYNFTLEYLKSNKRLLPVVIQGSNSSLVQSFLSSLQKTLFSENLNDIMPATHFDAAVKMIERWKIEFPETYEKFCQIINEPINTFVASLREYDINSYEFFQTSFPLLTSGSEFNPYIGFDVVELYTDVCQKILKKGYNGIYVVYDEFSKYLESNIENASVADIKMLQDFAEKCNRSGKIQMHILLISHKDINNYIDKLPKQKVDGWKGVSERFRNLEIHNNFSQIYEIIGSVIKKNEKQFEKYRKDNAAIFNIIDNDFKSSSLFSELTSEQINNVIYDCFPLHPMSTFILPRLSEKVAQNERTLFTFLSTDNRNTLYFFIKECDDNHSLLTPDIIYDYFETLFKKESYLSENYKTYIMTSNILKNIENDDLGKKIVKTIALIYMVGQFEKLPPTKDLILNTFRGPILDDSEILKTLAYLENEHYVIYVNRSNDYLKLKNTTGINIYEKISDSLEKNKKNLDVSNILRSIHIDNYIYPKKYNDDFQITRYFNFVFIESDEFRKVTNFEKKISSYDSDGTIFGILPKSASDIKELEEIIIKRKVDHSRVVFVLPKKYVKVNEHVLEYEIVKMLRDKAFEDGDSDLAEEYNIYLDDLEEVMKKYIYSYTNPENMSSLYYYNGEKKDFSRKSHLSSLLSLIAENNFNLTPIINNEIINKNIITSSALSSSKKIIMGLLASKLEPNLGLTGSNAAMSIMRSTLVQTDILREYDTIPKLNIHNNKNPQVQNALKEIELFFTKSSLRKNSSFHELYKTLTNPKFNIGMKKGVIPIFIAAVLHIYRKHAVVIFRKKEVEITADLLHSININPEEFYFYLENWNEKKTYYIEKLEETFKEYIYENEREHSTFSYMLKAIQRWFVSLPRYTKEFKFIYLGNGKFEKAKEDDLALINELKKIEINARQFLFERLLEIYNEPECSENVVKKIQGIKLLLDNSINRLSELLITDIYNLFTENECGKSSLSSVIKDWYESLNEDTINNVFSNKETLILELMKDITNNDKLFLNKLAKIVIGLRIDDWDDKTVVQFLENIKSIKANIDAFNMKIKPEKSTTNRNSYKLHFVDDNGKEIIKSFDKIKYSNRANLLFNEISAAIEEMGQAITDNEKRQVLMDIMERIL